MFWAFIFVLLAGLNSTIGNLLLKASRQNLGPEVGLIEQYTSDSFIGAILVIVL